MPIAYEQKDWLYQAEHPSGDRPTYFLVKTGYRYLVCKQFFNQAGEHHAGIIYFDDKDEAIEWIDREIYN